LNSQPKIPTTGKRNTQKVLGAVAIASARFVYRIQEEYFNHQTYVSYLQDVVLSQLYRRNHRIYLIQDNASYHKKPETYEWFKANRRYIEVQCLPSYQPELNAIERLWHHTRTKATHNRFHETVESLRLSLHQTFDEMQKSRELIKGYLQPYL
jgi:transposase